MRQKKFKGCFTSADINGKERCYLLPFDFYLPKYNTCIEYDGEGHYKVIYSQEGYERTKFTDKLKTKYCKKNGIKLIRIPYTMKTEEIEPYILKELGIK